MDGPTHNFIAIQSPGCTMVRLTGDIDFAAVIEIEPKLKEYADLCQGELKLDMSDVTFIDSEGLKMIIKTCEQMRLKGSHAKIHKISNRARRVIEIAGLSDILLSPSITDYSCRQAQPIPDSKMIEQL